MKLFSQLNPSSWVAQFMWSLLLDNPRNAPHDACAILDVQLPGLVSYPFRNISEYTKGNQHWAGTSMQDSQCTVEPATQQQVSVIFQVVNQTRTPWAVKGGGHTYNANFSSTTGLLIVMSRFNEITYDRNTSTARIGAGNIWDTVYAKLTPLGVNVVGGRYPGVGVAGFLLGGGYGWTTQQYGMAIDTIVAYDVVTPAGNILHVTNTTEPDLFFALKGGGNNFGIVTAFTMNTHPQGEIYGGYMFFNDIQAVADAVVDFDANNRDPKAAILVTYTYTIIGYETTVFLFYDGLVAPNGTFDMFLNIPSSSKDLKTRTIPDFINSLGLSPSPRRLAAHTIPIMQFTKPIVEQIINQTKVLGRADELPDFGLFASLSMEPFLRTVYDNSQGGAYPHAPLQPWTPFQILADYYAPWGDKMAWSLVKQSADIIHQVAIHEGQSSPDAILYNNYARVGTNLTLLFGSNLDTLRILRKRYDPSNIISLTGGWKL